MAYKVKRSDLKYEYNWGRDPGDSPSTGWQDDVKVDKDEGYEVITLIQSVYDHFEWESSNQVAAVEGFLQAPKMSGVQSRERLFNHLVSRSY